VLNGQTLSVSPMKVVSVPMFRIGRCAISPLIVHASMYAARCICRGRERSTFFALCMLSVSLCWSELLEVDE
jgi:hypothetical protein